MSYGDSATIKPGTLLATNDAELKAAKEEISHLERTVKEQANIIEDLKRQLFDKTDLESSQLLCTSNKISEQEARIFQFTIQQIQSELSALKDEALVTRDLLEKERLLCQRQAKQLEKLKKECEAGNETVEALKEQLKNAESRADESKWEERERTLRYGFQQERLEDEKRIALLEAKIKLMQRREDALRSELSDIQQQLADVRALQEEQMEECARDKDIELSKYRRALETTVYPSVKRSASTEDVLVAQVKALTAEIEKISSEAGSEQKAELLCKVGSLTASNTYLQEQLEKECTSVRELREKLSQLEAELETKKDELLVAQKRIEECENSAEVQQRYLLEESSRIKRQKAELRCELIELKRKYNRLLLQQETIESPVSSERPEQEAISMSSELSTLPTIREVSEPENTKYQSTGSQCNLIKSPEEVSLTAGVSRYVESVVCKECVDLRKQLETLRRIKMERFPTANTGEDIREKELNEKITIQKALIAKLEKDLLAKDEKIDEFRKALHIVDEQCEKLLELKKRAEAGKEKAMSQLSIVNEHLSEARRELDRRTQVDVDVKLLKQERERLAKKVEYLTEELRETHTDYRGELAALAKNLSQNKQKDASENESLAMKVKQLEAEKMQLETAHRSLERQLEQSKNEGELHAKQAKEIRDSQSSLVNENAKLREGLAVAIAKAEQYKCEAENLREVNESLGEDLAKAMEGKNEACSLVEQLQQLTLEKDRLVAYLQSQINMKSTSKIKKASSHATLISSASEVSIPDVAIFEDNDQENQCTERSRTKELETRPVGNISNVISSQRKTDNEAATPRATCTPRPEQCPATPASARAGIMKHDIPHRWKTYLVLKQAKCVICLEGLPRVRHALRCIECGLVVHRGCSRSVSNTCGLPRECADFYFDAQPSLTSNMSGWVKIWRSDDRSGNKWRSAWACIDEHRLCFFDHDGLAVPNQRGSPFLVVDLDKDQWRIHMQCIPDIGIKGGVSKESFSLLIELRMISGSLFILSPTEQAKQRWVRALQIATNRKMFVQRRPSAVRNGNAMLIGLDAPLNLTINCAQVLDDWLLIGAQEGLFIMPLSSPRIPFVVAGLTAVFHMELIADLDMLVAISGSQRQLFFLHVADVRSAFKSEQPAVRATPIANLSACHLMTVHVDNIRNTKWLCVADPEQIHILQFNSRLGIFSPFKSVSTNEPAMCLLSMGEGFVFGADHFYFVDMGELVPRPLAVPGCPSDWPLAAVAVGCDELMLAYHNYGVFCDTRGNRTRGENIDWNRAPLEFVYTAPYLYVVHYETLEVLQVADYSGPSSRSLLDERDVYRCHNAHYLGLGRSPGEVLFALSAKDRTEIHSFFGQERKTSSSSLKRKTINDEVVNKNVVRGKRCKS